MFRTNLPSAILFLCLATTLARACRHICKAGDPACDADPGPCDDGEAIVCGKRVCAKGPGEDCGGMHDQWGICGDGMICQASSTGMRGKCGHCSRTRYESGLTPTCAWIYRNIIRFT